MNITFLSLNNERQETVLRRWMAAFQAVSDAEWARRLSAQTEPSSTSRCATCGDLIGTSVSNYFRPIFDRYTGDWCHHECRKCERCGAYPFAPRPIRMFVDDRWMIHDCGCFMELTFAQKRARFETMIVSPRKFELYMKKWMPFAELNEIRRIVQYFYDIGMYTSAGGLLMMQQAWQDRKNLGHLGNEAAFFAEHPWLIADLRPESLPAPSAGRNICVCTSCRWKN